MEEMQSDLSKLFGTPDVKLNKDGVITILYNILCAVSVLHSCDIIHRDIKPANILIDENC
jgi:mitogen-activated protein kinase 1/3